MKERDYVRAARASGAGACYVMTTHVLPNVATPHHRRLHADGRPRDPVRIGAELPRLRRGAADAKLGQHAQQRAGTGDDGAGAGVYPGLLIFITVIAVNFLGDGLQHAFDPRSEA